MTWLLDVNVLLAIADFQHIFHRAIHEWLAYHPDDTWASCPMTENGFVRLLSQPWYPSGPLNPAEAADTLRKLKAAPARNHEFWDDEISITDGTVIDAAKLSGHGQITDVYLAALTLRKHGRLVTFDTRIPWHAVIGATAALSKSLPSEFVRE